MVPPLPAGPTRAEGYVLRREPAVAREFLPEHFDHLHVSESQTNSDMESPHFAVLNGLQNILWGDFTLRRVTP